MLLAFKVITLLPVALCLYVSVTANRKPLYQKLISVTPVVTVIASQLPLIIAAAVAASAILAFSLITKNQARDRHRPSPTPVIKAVTALVTVLLIENFMIWVVSATFEPGQRLSTAPPPLQDNGQRLLSYCTGSFTKQQVIGLRRLLNVQWSLVSSLGAAFVVVDVFMPHRALFHVGARATWTLAAARFIRTVSFLLTVLPNQHRTCYYDHHFPYPPPPAWTREWFWVGIMPNSHGGCNDLIISGHATVTSTMACVATSVSNDIWFSAALWIMLAFDFAVEIYEGFHYSVDMWLGMVLVSLLWRVLGDYEDSLNKFWLKEKKGMGSDDEAADCHDHNHRVTQSEEAITGLRSTPRDVVTYTIPALVAYIQLVFMPEWTANFFIVGFVIVALALFFQDNQDKQRYANAIHYVQHITLCLLFMALGIYL